MASSILDATGGKYAQARPFGLALAYTLTHTLLPQHTHTHRENPPFLSTGLHRKKKVGSNNKIHKYEFCEFDMKISQ